MRKLFLLIAIFFIAIATSAQPKQIKNFNELMDALNQGDDWLIAPIAIGGLVD